MAMSESTSRGGPTFRTMRLQAGVSTRSVASRAGVTHSTLSRWERGERAVSKATEGHLAQALADLMNESEVVA